MASLSTLRREAFQSGTNVVSNFHEITSYYKSRAIFIVKNIHPMNDENVVSNTPLELFPWYQTTKGCEKEGDCCSFRNSDLRNHLTLLPTDVY